MKRKHKNQNNNKPAPISVQNNNETKLSLFCSKALEYLWLFAIFSIPLWMTVNILPTTLKFYVFGIIVMLMLIFWIVRIIEIKKFEFKFNFLTTLIFLLLLSVIISTIFSLAPDLSFWGSERRQGLMSFVLYALFFVIVASSLKKKEQVEHIITALIAVGFINSLMAILQYYNMNIFATSSEMIMDNGRYRAYGATGNPLFLAGWFVMAIPLTAYRIYDFLKRKGWSDYLSYIYISILILEIIGLMFTFTRGAILAFVFSVFLGIIFFGIIRKMKWLWISGIIIFILTIAFVVLLNIPSNPLKIPKNNVITMRFSNLWVKDSSFYSRTLIWKMLIKPIREHFWVGVGSDAFGPLSYSKEYFDKELMKLEMSTFQKRLDRAHNIILDSMLATGIIGTIIMLGIFLYVLFKLFLNVLSKNENYKYLSLFLFLAVISYFVQGMTAFPDVSIYVLLFMIFAICYFIFKNNSSDTEEELVFNNQKKALSSRTIWWYLLLFIPLGFFFYYLILPPYANESNYFEAMRLLSGDKTKGEGKDLLISTWENNPRWEKTNNSVLGVITGSEDEKQITWFVDKLETMKAGMPEELFFPFMLSYTYHRWGELKNDPAKFQESEKALDDAMGVFGNKYQLYTTYIFILSDRCDFQKTDAKINEALGFSTYLKGQYYLYAVKGALACKNFDQAITYLNQITDVRDTVSYKEKYNTLGKIYVEKGDTPKAVESWKECVKINPSDTNCLGNIAIYYANDDKYDEALNYANLLKKADYSKGMDLIKQISALKAEFDAKIK